MYLVFMVVAAVMAPVALAGGYLEVTRFVLSVMFIGGASLSVIGYLRYVPGGSRIPALLALLFGKSLIFAILGLGFFVVAVGQGGTTNITPSLLLTYSCFAAAGAAMSFTGVYVLVGAGRGWINREVYKYPWLDGKGKQEDDSE